MMFPSHFMLVLCAAGLLVAAPQAQAQASNRASAATPEPLAASAPTPPPSRSGRSSHVSEDQAIQWFNLLDTNHKGCISRADARVVLLIAPRLIEDFNAADTNHDGCITPDEIRALVKRRRAERLARRAAQAQQKTDARAAQPDAPVSAPRP